MCPVWVTGWCGRWGPPAPGTAVGWHRVPTGLGDVSTYPALVAELLARNWTEEEVKAALSLNLLRVFKKVEEVSRAWGAQRAREHMEWRRQVGHQDIWHMDVWGHEVARGHIG